MSWVDIVGTAVCAGMVGYGIGHRRGWSIGWDAGYASMMRIYLHKENEWIARTEEVRKP